MFSIRAHTILVGEKPSAKSRFQGRDYTPPLMHFWNGSFCVSGGYKLEFAAIAFTASTYKRWRELRKSIHKCLSHKSLG